MDTPRPSPRTNRTRRAQGLPLEQLLGNLQKLVAPFHDRLKQVTRPKTGDGGRSLCLLCDSGMSRMPVYCSSLVPRFWVPSSLVSKHVRHGVRQICTSSTGEFTKASDLVEAASCLNLLGAAVRFLDFQVHLPFSQHPCALRARFCGLKCSRGTITLSFASKVRRAECALPHQEAALFLHLLSLL